MPLFWFLAGALTTLATLIVLLPWLRGLPRLAGLPTLPWQASVGAVLVVAAAFGLSRSFSHGEPAAPPAMTGSFGSAAKVFDSATRPAASTPLSGAAAGPEAAAKSGAGSMDSAIANLEARLAKGGGSADDWELLAKSFEFLGRPADAAKARAHQLPPLPSTGDGPGPSTPALAMGTPAQSLPAAGTAVSGEVTLAAGLSAKASPGETLFIVAKSVDSPGMPVAVYRGNVGSWPLKFTLDDTQSMMPGRNLSSAGRVTVEARISQNGQAIPSPGDLQGTTGIINPSDHKPLKIVIDKVIS
jgi:hypothetical protein